MRASDRFRYLKNNHLVADSLALRRCYGPLLGPKALAIYDYFLAFGDDGEDEHTFYPLLTHLALKPADLDPALEKLMALDLIAIYRQEDLFQIQLKQALSQDVFLSNPIYRYLLEGYIGQVALEAMLPQVASGKQLTVSLDKVFSIKEDAGIQQPSPRRPKEDFALESFKDLMAREGLSFQHESQDVLELYAISQEQKWTWYETYLLAKETAVASQISTKRMREKLGQSRPQGDFSPKEEAILKQAKSYKSLAFFKSIKDMRRAQVLADEVKAIEELARLGLLDEVINILLVYSMRKNQANLNRKYLLKIGNDFSNKRIQTAEEAILAFRQVRQDQEEGAKKKAPVSRKTNIPTWVEEDYKNETSPEEAAQLEERFRKLLAGEIGGD